MLAGMPCSALRHRLREGRASPAGAISSHSSGPSQSAARAPSLAARQAGRGKPQAEAAAEREHRPLAAAHREPAGAGEHGDGEPSTAHGATLSH